MCEVVLVRGNRKGQLCGVGTAPVCSRHKKMDLKKESRKEKNTNDLNEFVEESVVIDPAERIRKSLFAFTINTNKTVDGLTEEEKNKFKKIMKHLFDNNAIEDFIICRDGAPCFRENPELIVNKRVGYAFEIGGQFNKLHAHASLEIDHKTLISIDLPQLKELFRQYLGFAPHINIKTPKQISSITWEKYISKNNNIL